MQIRKISNRIIRKSIRFEIRVKNKRLYQSIPKGIEDIWEDIKQLDKESIKFLNGLK